MSAGIIEQVPRYTISHTDDGTQERLQLTVHLPGLTSAKDFEVHIQNDKFILKAKGRYNLTLPLHPPVEETAEVLQFVKKKALLKAELKVLSESDQAATRASSPAFPSRSKSPPSFAYGNEPETDADGLTSDPVSNRTGPWQKAPLQDSYAKAAPHRAGYFRGDQRGAKAPETDSEDELPDLVSNNSDSSPTFSSLSPDALFGNADVTATSESGESSPVSHARAHAPAFNQSTHSDESDSSPRIRHWPNSDRSAAQGAASAAEHDSASHEGSSASDGLCCEAELSSADSAEAQAFSSLWKEFEAFQQPQSKQSLDKAAAYFREGFALLCRRDWHPAAKLIFEAQMIERTTACCLSEGLERLQPTLQMDASRHIGKILTDSVEKRMDPNKLGAAKTVRAAVEQAHAVLLLAALGHPAADEYAMAYDLPIPEKAFQGATHTQASKSHAPPSSSSQPQAYTARSTSRKRPAVAQPSHEAASQADHDASSSSDSSWAQHQQEQFVQQMREQMMHPPQTAASYGPAEQAEAKRQANKEAALTWLDKAKSAAASKDWTTAVQRAQRGLSLDPHAEWSSQANRLVQSWQAAQGQQSADTSGSSKPQAKSRQGQQHQETKKQQSKKQKQQAQQQQQPKQQPKQQQSKPQQQQSKQQQGQPKQQQGQPKQQQPQQQQQGQERAFSSKQHGMPDNAADSHGSGSGQAPESAAHGQYSHTYGPQGQHTESAEPWKNGSASAHHAWLSGVLLPTLKAAAAWFRRGCRSLCHKLAIGAVCGAAVVLYCYLMSCKITAGLLYVTGRYQWRDQLAAAQQAGRWWAKLVYFVLSPLLALTAICAVFCFIVGGSFSGAAAMTASFAAWPLVKAWGGLRVAGSWLHPSRAYIHVTLLIARLTAKSRWVRVLSSGVLLYGLLGPGWISSLLTLLASAMTFAWGLETISSPVAILLSHLAITNTYLTGTMFGTFTSACFLILVWGIYLMWQGVMKEQFKAAAKDRPAPTSKPGADASRPAQPGPTRTGSTDPETEVKRILSAKTHYAVLELETNADEESVKRAKKMKSLLVHPDKAGNLTGAADAFGKVIDAAEVLCDASKRRQYDAEQAASAYRPSQPAAQQHRPAEEDDANVSYQCCSVCGELHKMVKTDISQQRARWCRECHCFHPVLKGEGWVTRKGFLSFFSMGQFVVYACLFPDGQIYDVTELSVCQGMLDSAAFRQLGPDCCKVWLHFGNPDAANRRQRYQPPNESSGRKGKGKKARKEKKRR